MTREDGPLAVARAIQRLMGAEGRRYIAEWIAELALEGDQAGVDRPKLIAAEYNRLIGATIQ